MKKPLVIGIIHTTEDPSYEENMVKLEKEIQHKMRIAIESPMKIEEIILQSKKCPCPQHTYLANLVKIIERNGAIPLPVEEIRAFNAMHQRKFWFMYEEKGAFAKDWIANYFSMYRSASHLLKAVEKNADVLLTGMIHAYDLDKWGYNQVEYIEEPSQDLKLFQEQWFNRPWSKSIKKRIEHLL